jgi:hypothetical protein
MPIVNCIWTPAFAGVTTLKPNSVEFSTLLSCFLGAISKNHEEAHH